MQYGGGYLLAKLCWGLALASLLFAFGCKQANNGKKNHPVPTPQADVVITVKGDEGISLKSPNTFKVKRNSTWKDVRDNAKSKIIPKENKDIKEWRLNDAKGKVLVDADKFDKDSTIFAISKEKDVPTPPTNSITITIEIDEGYTFKDESLPCTIKVDMGSLWSIVKTKVDAKIELKDDYEKTGWKLGGKNGGYIEDGYVFNEDVIVFAKSKRKVVTYKVEHLQENIENDEYTTHETENKEGDERIEVLNPPYIDFPLGTTKTFVEIKEDVKKKVKLKIEWDDGDYEVYDWRIESYDGDLMVDETLIVGGMKLYARSNYANFKWGSGLDANSITGYAGNKPKGRIIIPAKIIAIDSNAFKKCTELTAVDFRGCRDLKRINYDAFSGCSALEIVNLTGCSELTNIDLSNTAIPSIDLSSCPKINYINFKNCVKLESVDLSKCTALREIGVDVPEYNTLILPFSGCINAKVKLPTSVIDIRKRAFGVYYDSYCKKVLVPNWEVKKLVKDSGYPEDRIEMY